MYCKAFKSKMHFILVHIITFDHLHAVMGGIKVSSRSSFIIQESSIDAAFIFIHPNAASAITKSSPSFFSSFSPRTLSTLQLFDFWTFTRLFAHFFWETQQKQLAFNQHAYDFRMTIDAYQRRIEMFRYLNPQNDRIRICINIFTFTAERELVLSFVDLQNRVGILRKLVEAFSRRFLWSFNVLLL